MFSKSLLTIARPYAKAIFDFSYERRTLEKWKSMLVYAKNMTEDPMIGKLLSSRDYIRPIELSELFILIAQHNFDNFACNFIRVLSEYKRLHLIPIILDEFLVLYRERKMIMEVKIITSMSLNDKEISKITAVIKKKFLCKINIIFKLDQSIIGGFIFRINNFVLDGSIRGRIKRLKFILKNLRGKHAIKCC